jgi:imidazole glycerol-phosphate synthase subunit HisH
MIRISIFDYGAGNIFSLESSLKRNGAKVSIIKDFNDVIEDFDGLVLPGVGNIDPALISINKCRKKFLNYIEKNIPILGICLGMEMLFEKSEEGNLEGLKIIKGEVLSLPKSIIKIPHIGRNNLDIVDGKGKLFDGVPNNSWVYFVHSYYTVPEDANVITARSNYGISIPASIEKDNIFCTQFHPEKSSKIGEKMIKNFIKICAGSK